MNKKLLMPLVFLMVLVCFSTASAKDKAVVAVLPFSVHSADNIDYVQMGILDMLSSRLSANGSILLTGKDVVLSQLAEFKKKDLAAADVYALGKKINADFVVWGSITKIGNNVSIDGKLFDISSYKSPVGIFAQSQGLDDIIPKINDFAQRITNEITGGSPAATPTETVRPSEPQPSPQAAREKIIIAGMRAGKKGTMTSVPINPDFINTPQALNRKEFWMSQTFGTEFKGMDIGDVNNDGINEIVIIDNNNVMIYQKKGTAMVLVQQIPGPKFQNYLAVDLADINGNGIKEIIVTSMAADKIDSFILEWREGKIVPVADHLPWFMRVVQEADDMPILIGQTMGTDSIFDAPIHEITWEGNRYKEGRRMKIPQGLSVYGLALSSIETRGSDKIIAFDDNDFLNIYEKTDKPIDKIKVFGGSQELIWRGDEEFGGSNSSIVKDRQPLASDEQTQRAYIKPRIITYDTNKDGKKEIILLKNLSSTGRYFKNTQVFANSEIYNLEWDGTGMAENWRTKKINGYIADYQFKDVDNDGQNEIVLALVLSVGFTFQEKSVIAAYKLSPPEAADNQR